MRIEITTKGTEKFYREIVNVTTQYRRLLKKPAAKIADNITIYRKYSILAFCLAAVLLALQIIDEFDLIGSGMMALMIICGVLGMILYKRCKDLVKNYMTATGRKFITANEEGIQLEHEGQLSVKVSWDNVAFVRVLKESVCIITKMPTGMVLGVSHEVFEQIRGEIRAEILQE